MNLASDLPQQRMVFASPTTSSPQLRHVIQTGEPIIEGEVEAETPAHPGERRHYMHNYYPDKSKDGTVVGVSCVVQDITKPI